MKTNITGKQNASHPQKEMPHRPENKDNLDSREGEEQLDKGNNNTTHNKKEKQSERKHKS